MSILYQPNLALPAGATAPDTWDSSLGMRLPPEFVVSRRRNGEPASRRGDLYWDWSAYEPRGQAVGLSFAYWWHRSGKSKVIEISAARQPIVDDMQHLMTIVIYKRSGASLAYKTLHGYMQGLAPLAEHCEKHSLTIPAVLSSEKLLSEYVYSMQYGRALQGFTALIAILMTLNPEQDIGYPVAGNAVITTLRERYRAYRAQEKQTPPIPTRIYSAVITAVGAQLMAFAEVADRYLALTAEVLENTKKRQEDEDHTWTPILVTKYGLDAYFEAQGLAKSAKGISRGLTEAQLLCKLTIHIYSGMRDIEASSLPYYCTETERAHGRVHYLICGQTTKLNKGKVRRTKWVTNAEGHAAIGVAQRIAMLIYTSMGCTPEKVVGRLNSYPLFVSTGYLPLNGRPPASHPGVYQTQRLRINQKVESRVEAAIRPLIEEQDLRELEEIDPHRAWRTEEDMQIGQPWPLATHQFRRSLALYAQRSGLVSLPSLRRQLQHITKEMSLYYSKGSFFARNFIEDDPEDYKTHMARDWREAKPLSEALAYLREVLFTDEELFGGAGTFEQQKKNKGIVVDREAMLRKFKKGEIAYKETPVGGCVKVGDCDQVGLKLLETDCLKGCKNLIGKLPRLERLIDRQTKLVGMLDPSTVEYRMEQSDLTVLKEAHAHWVESSERRARGLAN